MANDSVPAPPGGDETIVYSRGGFTPPSPAELAARIPNLEVTRLLGQGGMGVVYEGRQPLLDRAVAIKVIRPDVQNESEFQERFLREARTLAKLRHPYVVSVYDVGKAEQLYYLVMEYVEGTSLRTRLAEKSVTPRDAVDFVPQIAQALQHAHDAGVVHRDVKPENVLVDAHGRVRLVDFGLATLLGPEVREGAADVAGTPGYMAPEQLTMPWAVDHRADIYSTGVVFYEMLAGERPKADRIPPSRKAATDPRLDPIVLRAMERERERRYQSARLLHDEITAVARTPETSLRIEKTIDAPPEAVFAAWTDPRGMADWLAPSDEFGPTSADVSLQAGGTYQITMRPPDREPVVVGGQYCAVDEPRTLSFTWLRPAHGDGVETQVTVELNPRGHATDLVLTHERFRSQSERDSHAKGWQGCVNRLVRKFGG